MPAPSQPTHLKSAVFVAYLEKIRRCRYLAFVVGWAWSCLYLGIYAAGYETAGKETERLNFILDIRQILAGRQSFL